MPHYSLGELARAIDAEAEGDLGLRLTGLAEPQSCKPDQLAVAMDPKYIPALAKGQARAAILPAGADWQALGLEGAVFVTRPRLSMSRVTAAFKEHTLSGAGPAIHETAVIGANVTLGEGVRIGALAVIDDGAVIGAGSQVGPQVWIGQGVTIGENAELAAGTRIMPGTRAGDRLFTHPGVVIGSDGFSFVTLEKSAVESVRETLQDAAPDMQGQAWLKIESLGGVQIGDDVEIGANSMVDAGTIRPTVIGSGTKIDALVQIAHNVQIGRNCLICGHSGVAGSTVIGDNCVLGGMTGVADNVVIGDGVIAAGGSKIVGNVPPGRAVFGYPAVKMDTHIETYRALRRLPRALARLAKLEKALAAGGDRD